jgi:hypothetical protein
MIAVMDVDAEIREYQWRRKFESGPRRTRRNYIVAFVILLVLIAIARAVARW